MKFCVHDIRYITVISYGFDLHGNNVNDCGLLIVYIILGIVLNSLCINSYVIVSKIKLTFNELLTGVMF